MDIEIEFIDDEEEEATEEQQQEEGEGEEEEQDGPPFYADESSTFIPLTWSTKLPRTWYRGSDPEWQEFIKIAKDAPRHKKVQDQLVQIVYTGASQHPQISRQLGKDAKVGKYWLDISFPDGPPQEFERSGIEIGDGFVAWSQQRVSQEKQWRLMRALWPYAAANSSWATLKVLAGIQYRRVKQMLGWDGPDPMAPEERFKTAMEMMSKQQNQGQQKNGVSKAQTEPNGSPGAVVSRTDASTPSSSAQSPSDGSRPRAPPTPSDDSWLKSIPLPNVSLPSSSASEETANTDIPIAMHVFQSTLRKSWNPKKMEPPRGTFVVQGLVEIRGSRGRFMFDVQSAYDPKAGKYIFVNAGVRGYKRWSQSPRGGS
jgi:hypothetical protein